MNIHWKYSGSDWKEIGKSRVWLFAGNRVCVQYDLRIEDCDGDFAYWSVKVGSHEVAHGQCADTDEAIQCVIQYLLNMKDTRTSNVLTHNALQKQAT
jgi:hypothetical protein